MGCLVARGQGEGGYVGVCVRVGESNDNIMANKLYEKWIVWEVRLGEGFWFEEYEFLFA